MPIPSAALRGLRGNLLSDGVRTFTYDAANRLTSVTSGTLTTAFEYDGLGNRTAQTVDGVTTEYVLDVAGGLPEVIVATTGGASTRYVQVQGQILAQQDSGAWTHILADHLGSVRQLVGSDSRVDLAQSFDPFGVLFETSGSGESDFAYTGEWWDSEAGVVFLRARYYDPVEGRFVAKDPWPGDELRPQSVNGWSYVEGNPVSGTDPTGLRYSSEPIHRMIQVHFEANFARGRFESEYAVRSGSKTGLDLEFDDRGNPFLTGTPTGNVGWIDIVDIVLGVGEAYEIKPQRELARGIAEINWYITVYNANPDPLGPIQLRHGRFYPMVWQVIGTNPWDPSGSSAILSRRGADGVIIYKGIRKNKIPIAVPEYVWEYDKRTRTVRRQELAKAWVTCGAEGITEEAVGKTVIIAGTPFVIWGLWQIGQLTVGFLVGGPPGAVVGVALPP
jgi:RHS repeat-associated protein